MSELVDTKVHVRFKLAALWASLMSCYIYGDYFGLYVPGKLKGMLGGEGPIGPASEGTLVVAALLLALPALMIALSILLRPGACRWLNIVFGVFYALVMAVTLPHAWLFYQVLGVVEIALSLVTVVLAWRWPRG